MRTYTRDDLPELGTTEAAVAGFVNLLAHTLEVTEEALSFWLDSYYQLRQQYERENAPEPDPTIIRRADLEPVIRKLWDETLHKGCRKEAAKRLAEKEATEAPPKKAEDPALSGFEPVSPPPSPAAAAAFKREQKERLDKLRKEGTATIGKLCESGLVTHDMVLGALNGQKMPIEDWRLLKAAMDALERSGA